MDRTNQNSKKEEDFMQDVSRSMKHIDYAVSSMANSMEKMAAALLAIAKRMPREATDLQPSSNMPPAMLQLEKEGEDAGS